MELTNIANRIPRSVRGGPKTLKQLGISETQSSRWQALAVNPKAVAKYLRDGSDVPTKAPRAGVTLVSQLAWSRPGGFCPSVTGPADQGRSVHKPSWTCQSRDLEFEIGSSQQTEDQLDTVLA